MTEFKPMGKRDWSTCLSRLVDVYWDLSHAGYKSEAKKVENLMKWVDDRLQYCGKFGALNAEIEMRKESEATNERVD